jgi:hypothetical protein
LVAASTLEKEDEDEDEDEERMGGVGICRGPLPPPRLRLGAAQSATSL